MFRLSKEEMNQLVADCDRLKNMKHSSALPCAFTEQGVAMLSAVLHSPIAVKVSINIMNAFVLMRRNMLIHSQIVDRLEKVERKQFVMEESLEKVFSKLDNTPNVLMEGIFYGRHPRLSRCPHRPPLQTRRRPHPQHGSLRAGPLN